jgi:hypothetical protein
VNSDLYNAITAGAACAAVAVALIAVWRQNRAVRRLTRQQLFLQMAAQWDSADLQRKRAQLARTLLVDRHTVELDDTVLVFFETLAYMTRRGMTDRDLVWTTFTVDVCSYWGAVAHYVRHVRERFSDPTLVVEMQWLRSSFRQKKERHRRGVSGSQIGVSDAAIEEFLRWESRRGDELIAAPTARIPTSHAS